MKWIVSCTCILLTLALAPQAFSKECQSIELEQIVEEPEYKAALDRAWIDSAEGTPDEHEEGFALYHCRSIRPDVCPAEYDYTTEVDRYPRGTRDSIMGTADRTDPDCRIVLEFHTHPGVGRLSPFSNDEYANNFFSDSDIAYSTQRKVMR